MKTLHDAIRTACAPRTWSRGVELARADAVIGEESGDDEVVCRVVQPGRKIPPTVVLYPEDEEWDCDCGGKLDPCEHVAAAVIAVARARERGDALPVSSQEGGRVSYRFRCEAGGLYLDRFIVLPNGREERLAGTLSGLLSRPADAPSVTPSETDLTVDALLGPPRRRSLSPDKLPRLFELLAGDHDVRIDGEPVETAGDPIAPCAIIDDVRGGVRLRLVRDPRVTAVVAHGVVRAGGVIHAAAETELSGSTLEHLPFEKIYANHAVGELVTDLLPELEKRIPVTVKSRRLPGRSSGVRPRLAFDIAQEPGGLSVLATLVYGDPPQARIDGGRLVHIEGAVPKRDEATERALVHRLRDELNLVPGQRARFEGRDAIAFSTRLQKFQGEGARSYDDVPELVPTLETSGGQLAVSFAAGEDGAEGSARGADVLQAWRDGFDIVPLSGGGFGRIPASWLEEHGHLVAQILAGKDRGQLPAYAAPAAAALCDELDHPRPPELERLAPLVDGWDGIPEAELPGDLDAELRGYQRAGANWLAFLRDAGLGGVLADDMGLGKTLQALCAVSGRVLVVCPASVAHNWSSEIQRFRPGLRASLYHGPRRALGDAEVTITTYGILRQDADRLAAERWDAVILDEAQAIKNPDSQVARAAYALEAPFRLTLTGTPVENRLDELWSQLHFTNPGLLGGRAEFQDRFARPAASGDAGAAARLRQLVRPFVLRRLKRDVAPELPPRTEMVLRCELGSSERAVYDAVRAAAERDVVQTLEQGGGVLAALEALLRLRQASCHPALVPGHEAETSSKIQLLLEHLEEVIAEGHKALVFSQFTSLLDLVEPHLERAGIARTRLDGSTSDRGAVVRAFQDADGPPVLLISLKAGGTGLNLTEADHVYLLDPWWNPAAEDQAADRAHRIGQDKPVMVYRLVAEDTVEDRILALQDKKRALVDTALAAADRAATITRDDLLALLH